MFNIGREPAERRIRFFHASFPAKKLYGKKNVCFTPLYFTGLQVFSHSFLVISTHNSYTNTFLPRPNQ